MILNTIDDLIALTSIPSDNHVHVMGYNTPADGGGGDFYWDATSTEAANGGTIFDCGATVLPTPPATLSTGKWLRYYSESINLKWFGAVGDSTTDDSAAFQNMVDCCEKTGIKDAVIPHGDFYLENSVYVKIGGTKFIGQGSLQREESWAELNSPQVYPGYNTSVDINIAYKGANIIIKNDISGIIYDTTVTDSVYWRNVGFRAEHPKLAGSTYAIDFRSKHDGLVWPFNVHECYFYGFNRVFNFDSAIPLYNVAFINITNCAFGKNDEVFYHGFRGSTDDRYYCWGFNFENNKCHRNSRVIYGHFVKDLVTIRNNNFEGNEQYSDATYPSHVIDIEIASCSVSFHGNHFEGMVSDCVSISSFEKNAAGNYKATSNTSAGFTSQYVDIYGNNFDGVQSEYKLLSLTGCVVKINEHIPIHVHSCEILENGNSNVFLTEYAKTNGTIIKFTNRPWLSSNFVKDLYNYQILTNSHAGSYFEDQSYLAPDGEQWLRTKINVFNLPNNYYFDDTDVTFCITVYKIRNNSEHFTTNESNRYNASFVPKAIGGMAFPPYGESLMVCIFPSETLYNNPFRSAISFASSGSESIEVCSSVFAYLTKSDNPEVVPVFESSDVTGEYGTFMEGQTWYNGENLRVATASGTVGRALAVTVIAESDNKIQLSNVSYIAQGQYIDITTGGTPTTYRIIELRDDWATLDTTPSSSVFNEAVTFHAPTFSDVVTGDNIDDYAILNQNLSAQPANMYIDGTIQSITSLNTVQTLSLGTTSVGYDNGGEVKFLGANGADLSSVMGGYGNAIWNGNDAGYVDFKTLHSGSMSTGMKLSGDNLNVGGTIRQGDVTAAMLKANSSGDIVAATAGTDYVAPSFLESGTYIPTVTPITDLTGTFTPSKFMYTRIGDIVHVAGSVSINITPGTATHLFLIDLPISTTIASVEDVSGAVSGYAEITTFYTKNYVEGDISGNSAKISFASESNNTLVYVQFDYIVQ